MPGSPFTSTVFRIPFSLQFNVTSSAYSVYNFPGALYTSKIFVVPFVFLQCHQVIPCLSSLLSPPFLSPVTFECMIISAVFCLVKGLTLPIQVAEMLKFFYLLKDLSVCLGIRLRFDSLISGGSHSSVEFHI